MTLSVQIDHLVVHAATLAQGEAWALHTLGVRPTPGGQHTLMGTHNSLLRLGPSAYLEIIAVDSQLPPPQRARWFAMDDPAQRERIAQAPRLVTFVARTPDLDATLAACDYPENETLALARGDFRWRITVPKDGVLPELGLMPTLIQWESASPVASLPNQGLDLVRLRARHPHPRHLQARYRELGLNLDIEHGAQAQLLAELKTPLGIVPLQS